MAAKVHRHKCLDKSHYMNRSIIDLENSVPSREKILLISWQIIPYAFTDGIQFEEGNHDYMLVHVASNYTHVLFFEWLYSIRFRRSKNGLNNLLEEIRASTNATNIHDNWFFSIKM